MKLEDVIPHLRSGKAISRLHKPEEYLKCTFHENGEMKHLLGSFCMTIYDIIADDWVLEE